MSRLSAFFRRRSAVTGILLALFVFAALFVAVNVANAPASSPVDVARCAGEGGECLRFPTVSGTSLTGQHFTLPDGFTGNLNLIIMPFTEDQQVRAASWLPIARELAAAYPDFAYYDLPVLPDLNPLVRVAVTGGMALVIAEDLRAISIMLFLEDLDLFLSALEIPDREATEIFLLDADGDVLWRARGDYKDASGAELREIVPGFAGQDARERQEGNE